MPGQILEYYGFSANQTSSSTSTQPGQITTSITIPASSTTTTLQATTTVQHTTSTTTTAGICPAAQLLGNNSKETNLIRTFRDKILLRQNNGSHLVSLYYRHAPELFSIISSNRQIAADVRKVLIKTLPIMEGLLQGDKITMESATSIEIRNVCDQIAAIATPGLRNTMHQVQAEFNGGVLFRELGLNR